MARRQLIEQFVTQRAQPDTSALERILKTGSAEIGDDEMIDVLMRSVRALYEVNCWLADELDQIEATIPAR